MDEDRSFKVNTRSTQATRSIGKGQTALDDFWAIMKLSQNGLHKETYQGHLKNGFKPPFQVAVASVFHDVVAAV